MSRDFTSDIQDLYQKFGFNDVISKMDKSTLKQLLYFRVRFLEEELDELKKDLNNKEDVVDALIDLIVVAIGTLDMFQVDTEKAWNEVLRANSTKETGIKESRPNPLGLPDLIKPNGWEGPKHQGNYGILP